MRALITDFDATVNRNQSPEYPGRRIRPVSSCSASFLFIACFFAITCSRAVIVLSASDMVSAMCSVLL